MNPTDELNQSQIQAVLHTDGPLMVLAGAGSGKTRVITRRVARMLRDGTDPHSILALTFTNKAAGEMAHRIEELGGRRVFVSTFHSAAARFLRIDGHHLGLPKDYSIYDTYDRDSLIKVMMDERHLQTEGVKASDIGRRISRLKNLDIAPEQFVAGLSPVDSIVAELYGPLRARMMALGALDFDDLLLRFCDLLTEHPDLAAAYSRRYRYLLVDEFQDTNLVQYRMLRLLTAEHDNLCVVGDPDQSIYGFRGAEIRNILDFERDYPNTAIIRLEINYRSTACILQAAQAVIENNEQRMEKTLRTDQEFGAPLRVDAAESSAEEAELVAQRIADLLDAGVGPDEIAVFYRAHFLSRAVEQALRNRGLPYQVVGGLAFFERREIKDLLAFLRVVANPLDDVSMMRVINVPPRGIGKVTVQNLSRRAQAAGMSLFEAVMDEDMRSFAVGKAKAGLKQLAELFAALRTAAVVADAFEVVLDQTDYLSYATGLGDPEDVTRAENIAELRSDMIMFGQEHSGKLTDYLQHVSLLTSVEVSKQPGPRVSLMTVHTAKGLEFDYVFVIGMEEGIFPHARALEHTGEIEEERRLMYVAMTRARRELSLSYARFRMFGGTPTTGEVSCFLAEIPPGCLATARGGAWRHPGRTRIGRDSVGEAGFEFDPGPSYDFEEPDFGEAAPVAAGTRVVHAVYGHGKVLRVRGSGERAKLLVEFGDGRQRTLLPQYESLQVLPFQDDCAD